MKHWTPRIYKTTVKQWRPRIYKTAPGYVGFGVSKGPDHHIAVQFWRWVLTTSPE